MRTLLQVVLLPDRTRVFAQLFGRYRRFGYAAIGIYGFVVAIVGATEFVKYDGPDGLWPVLFLLTAGTYALMMRSPLDAWRLAFVAFVFEHLVIDYTPVATWQWLAVLPSLAFVALFYSRGVVGWVTGLSAVLLVWWPGELQPLLFALVIAVVGYLVGARGRAEQRVEEERAAKGALVERARIAREMHDIVAHHMSNVVVRCETAPYRISGLSEDARREFGEVGEAARSAITDMQRLLGVLRANGDVADREPLPGIEQIPGLARKSGVVAEVDADGVPEAVGLTAFRVVQEAITNAQRHAPGADVAVRVVRDVGGLDVSVRNTAGGASLGGGGGHGLAGMRERVGVHGGSLEAHGTEDGGFLVHARIPLGG
ncbi:histidine kinase [Lentzea sp. NBRC 105346]|uniref:sensor histidine kinase n=1 Tax=Lentzea sp. NBRC 105346 TaxID=3032205 RepID=UPI002552F6BC|nr:histidine kinase [Lentzea sp. NBRC 105346]